MSPPPTADDPPRQPPARPPSPTRRYLHRMLLAEAFGSAWVVLTAHQSIGGAQMVRFGETLGMREADWGLLAAMPFVGAFFQLLGSYLVERFGRRKRVFIVGSLIQRLTWFAVAALPFAFAGPARATMVALLGLVLVQSAGGATALPGAIRWFADLVPRPIQGRFFGARHRIGVSVVAPLALLVGWLLAGARDGHLSLPCPAGWTSIGWWRIGFDVSMGRLCAALFAAGAVLGTIDVLLFVKVPQRPAPPARRPPGLAEIFGPPLKDGPFGRFLAFQAAFSFGLVGLRTYFLVYALNRVGISEFWAQLMFVVLGAVATIPFAVLWGRLIDRFGRKNAWRIFCAVLAVVPLMFALLGPRWWWMGFPIALAQAVFWNGLNQTNFNALLHFAADRDSPAGRRAGSSSYQAIFFLASAVAGTLSGLLFAGVARLFGPWQAHLGPFELGYFHVQFALGTAVMLAACGLLLPRLADERRGSTAAALAFVLVNVYGAIEAVLTLPVRLFGVSGRDTGRPGAVKR